MTDSIHRQIAWLAADWGSSNLRVWALDSNDQVIASQKSAKGMLSLMPTAYEDELYRLVADWLPEKRVLDVMVCGMAGARQGWQEAAYLALPTRLERLYLGAVQPRLTHQQLRVHLLPGLSQGSGQGSGHDVMRGEETQLAGLAVNAPAISGVACLPGTHSKWATLDEGSVTRFATFLTGELYQLLASQSVLSHSIGSEALDDEPTRAAFRAAVNETFSAPETFTNRLFRLRAQDLLDTSLPGGETRGRVLAARLSGLAIGIELAGARSLMTADEPVTLIGGGPLCQRYRLALESIGQPACSVDGDSAVLAGLTLAHRALASASADTSATP